jgi:small subunit ribosomal protein S16
MSLKIRLRRMGSKKKPFYRFVAIDSRMARDGRFVEIIGYYDPMTAPPKIHVEEETLFKWLGRGASPTVNVASLLRRVGSLQKWELMKAGVSGAELDARVEAIKNQRLVASEREHAKKFEEKAKKEDKKEEVTKAEESTTEGAGSSVPEAPGPEAPAAES